MKSELFLLLSLILQIVNTVVIKVYNLQFACWLNLLSEGNSSVLQMG